MDIIARFVQHAALSIKWMEWLAFVRTAGIVRTFGRRIFVQNHLTHPSLVSAAKLAQFVHLHNGLKIAFFERFKKIYDLSLN